MFQGNSLIGLNDNLLTKADAFVGMDMCKNESGYHFVKLESFYGPSTDLPMQRVSPLMKTSPLASYCMYGSGTENMHELFPHESHMTSTSICAASSGRVDHYVPSYHPIQSDTMTSCSVSGLNPHIQTFNSHSQFYNRMQVSGQETAHNHYHSFSVSHLVPGNTHPNMPLTKQRHHHINQNHYIPKQSLQPWVQENDCDPRELEMFAVRFKQRRIKLGFTQADVGSALSNLNIAGSLSQSTICRFESLTLSHNNMIALKPVLLTWLDEAERQASELKSEQRADADRKRKRTSIATPEKRSLEAYFAVQPRPSSERITQIAGKLDLKKNVVRVWFCNQRQKQKRMKFSAIGLCQM